MKRRTWITGVIAVFIAGAAILAWRASAQVERNESLAVSSGEVEMRVTGPGTLQARVQVTISSRISAQIVALHADHGDRVVRGQLLAVIDDRDLDAKRAAAQAAGDTLSRNVAAAEASLAKSQADLDLARNRQRRDLELHRAGYISQSAYDTSSLGLKAAAAGADNAAAQLAARQAEARAVSEDVRYAQALWSYTRIAAPIDGLVIHRAVEVGSMVTPGATLFRVVDPATLWIAARIDESLVEQVAEGQPARIRLRSGSEYSGRVTRVSRQSDAATRELEVNVAFDAPPARFAIDQEAEVSILTGVERGLVVPTAALVNRDGRRGVVVMRDGRALFQPVRVTASDGRLAVIAEGVDAGTRLAAWTSR